MADQLGGVGEPEDVVLDGHGEALAVHGVRRGVGVRARVQREVLVEEGPATGDDLVTADLVVVLAGREVALARDHVGAVERVVEGAPPGVHRVGGEPRVEQRDDELGSGDAGHLVVDVGRGRRDLGGLVEQVADLAQEARCRLAASGVPGCSRCQSSMRDCSSSRRASSSRLRGARSWTIASTPSQKACGSTPEPGSASSSTNR